MVKMLDIETYNLITGTTETRIINIDQVVEIVKLLSFNDQPLTRVKLANGDFLDVQREVNEMKDFLNQQFILAAVEN